MSGFNVAAGLEEVSNPDLVALALRRIEAGLRSHIEPGRFPGATLLVPLGPSGRPVVTESFRTVPVFSDLEALRAWTALPLGFSPDAQLEPAVAGVGTIVLPEGTDELLAQGAYVVVLNPAGPGASHLAGVVGETSIRPEDLRDPSPRRGFLGRPKPLDGHHDPWVNLDRRAQLRDRVASPLSRGVAFRDNGQAEQALRVLKEADLTARTAGDWMNSATAALHAARLLMQKGERSAGTGLANLAAMGSSCHAKPRLQLEGLLISAEGMRRSCEQGGNVAAGAASWTADWMRRLAGVAVEQGSMSSVRHDELCRRADAVAATYNNPRNTYDPDDWTPQGWAKANNPGLS